MFYSYINITLKHKKSTTQFKFVSLFLFCLKVKCMCICYVCVFNFLYIYIYWADNLLNLHIHLCIHKYFSLYILSITIYIINSLIFGIFRSRLIYNFLDLFIMVDDEDGAQLYIY